MNKIAVSPSSPPPVERDRMATVLAHINRDISSLLPGYKVNHNCVLLDRRKGIITEYVDYLKSLTL